MSKSKRKVSASQQDKSVIEAAKRLKKAGILSSKANLHSGRYVSRGVLKKVLENADAVRRGYKAFKVSRAIAAQAKERGYRVVRGNYIVGPNEGAFKKRITSGQLTGLKPVRGGHMEEVILPHGVMDMHSLVERLKAGIDDLKEPGENFAFKYFGNESYRAFRNTEDLLNYLTTYKSIFADGVNLKAEDLQEEFQNLVLFRLHPSDARDLLVTPRQQRQRSKAKRNRTAQDRRRPTGRSMADKLAIMPESKAKRIRDKMAQKARNRRANMTPEVKAAYREQARIRARQSYENKKPKK